jgi:hypothetical protein
METKRETRFAKISIIGFLVPGVMYEDLGHPGQDEPGALALTSSRGGLVLA